VGWKLVWIYWTIIFFEVSLLPNRIPNQVMTSAKWGYAGGIMKIAIQLVAQAFLVRLLGPGEYGVFAIGLMVVSLSIFFADSGTGAALIQRQVLTEEAISFAFSIQVAIGCVVTLMVLLSSELIALFYNEPRAINVVRALSLVIFITATGSISSSLLKKKLDFKNLQIGQVGGFFIGYVLVGIPVALSGAGVWSLVVAWLVQSVFATGYWYLKVRHPLKLSFSAPEGKDLFGFAGGTIISNLSTWAGGNIDKIIVGRMMSSADLGLYSVPFTFLGTVATQVLGTLQPLLFSASSRINSDEKALQNAYLELLEGVALVLLPVFITIAVVPEVVLEGIYGPLWINAAGIMQAAAICMATYVLGAIGTPILWALAQVKSEAKLQLIAALLIVIVSVPLSRYSASAVGWGVAAVSLGRMLWVVNLVRCALNLNWKDCIRAIRPACIASVSCVMGTLLLVDGSAGFEINGILKLVYVIAACFFILIFSMLIMHGRYLSVALNRRLSNYFSK
jgi:O-antigen/teichoic acid export membrane protein